MSVNPVSLLLVEDDDLDAEAFRRALRKLQIDVDLRLASDGAEALRVLREGVPGAAVNDYLVVLDLNMPGMNGHEFLAELRGDPELKATIVFVLTSSDHDRDIRMAYSQNVAGYFLKPQMDSLMSTMLHYVEGVKYPPQLA
jgi:hypothetical protein